MCFVLHTTKYNSVLLYYFCISDDGDEQLALPESRFRKEKTRGTELLQSMHACNAKAIARYIETSKCICVLHYLFAS